MAEAFEEWWKNKRNRSIFMFDSELAYIFFEEIWLKSKDYYEKETTEA